MTERIGRGWLVVFAGAVAASISLSAQDDGKDKKDQKEQKKASLALKASPPIAFSPARMVVSAELKGGSDETDDYYCPNLEWDWGDGTKSESNQDCAPFEAGKSNIDRRFSASHTFEIAGQYRVMLRLRRGTKTIVSGNINVQVKPGVRDQSEF
jgi:hypothetical protein